MVGNLSANGEVGWMLKDWVLCLQGLKQQLPRFISGNESCQGIALRPRGISRTCRTKCQFAATFFSGETSQLKRLLLYDIGEFVTSSHKAP